LHLTATAARAQQERALQPPTLLRLPALPIALSRALAH
jgi:hypothetical protein